MTPTEPQTALPDSGSVPVGPRAALIIGIALIVAGALGLAALNRDALVIDLSHLAGMIFCF